MRYILFIFPLFFGCIIDVSNDFNKSGTVIMKNDTASSYIYVIKMGFAAEGNTSNFNLSSEDCLNGNSISMNRSKSINVSPGNYYAVVQTYNTSTSNYTTHISSKITVNEGGTLMLTSSSFSPNW
jgi:hypothetical protein